MSDPESPKAKYTRWAQPYEAALARGHDHGSAAYIADQWEAKHMHETGGTGIIKNITKHNRAPAAGGDGVCGDE